MRMEELGKPLKNRKRRNVNAGGLLSKEKCWTPAYEIPYETMYERGIRGVIFDIDNTLVPHGAPADERALDLFRRFHQMGMKTLSAGLIIKNQGWQLLRHRWILLYL